MYFHFFAQNIVVALADQIEIKLTCFCGVYPKQIFFLSFHQAGETISPVLFCASQ